MNSVNVITSDGVDLVVIGVDSLAIWILKGIRGPGSYVEYRPSASA